MDELKDFQFNSKSKGHTTPLQKTVEVPRRETVVKSTLYLPKNLHRFVKKKCATNELYLKEYFEKLIEYDQKNNVI